MKLGIVTPTRGDRPEFLKHRHWLMEQQTRQPDEDAVVDYAPADNQKDLVPRYWTGINALLGEGCDLIACIEDDDWYHPTYLERLLRAWIKHGQPGLIGSNQHCYYHLRTRQYFVRPTTTNAPMMMTGLTDAVLKCRWPAATHITLDLDLWKQKNASFPRKMVTFEPMPAIGIKHGIGVCGGRGHQKPHGWLDRNDDDGAFLKSIVDEKSFKFYMKMSNKLRSKK